MAAQKAHVAPWKKDEVVQIEKILTDHPVVAIVGITGIPSANMQKIRAGLRGKAEVRSGKNNLLQLALEGAEKKVPGIKQLEPLMDGQTALVGSELNPFQLYKQFSLSRTRMAAKAGQKAPFDIEIQRGDTPFKPGPIVGELQKAGIPAAIDQGKVVIKSTKVVVKKGDVISGDLAAALAKLEIHPIEVGLDVKAVFEKGMIYKADVLHIDEAEFQAKLGRAVRSALGLALEIGWATKATIEPLVGKAAKSALAVGAATKTLTKESVPEYLRTAFLQMSALMKQKKGEPLDDDEKAALGAATAAAAPAKAEAKKEEKEEEKGVSEEEAAAGLGALFG